jgi:hypothetical protein
LDEISLSSSDLYSHSSTPVTSLLVPKFHEFWFSSRSSGMIWHSSESSSLLIFPILQILEQCAEKNIIKGEESNRWVEKIHGEEDYNMYSPTDNGRVINSRGTGWSGHIARM